MNLRTLKYFVAIADAGSFTGAAATIPLAQPALTRQIIFDRVTDLLYFTSGVPSCIRLPENKKSCFRSLHSTLGRTAPVLHDLAVFDAKDSGRIVDVRLRAILGIRQLNFENQRHIVASRHD